MSLIVYPVPQPSRVEGRGRVTFPLQADRVPPLPPLRAVTQPDPITVRLPQIIRVLPADLLPPRLLWTVVQPAAITVRGPGLGFIPFADLPPPRLLQRGTGQDLPFTLGLSQWFKGAGPAVPVLPPPVLLWKVVQPDAITVGLPRIGFIPQLADLLPPRLVQRSTGQDLPLVLVLPQWFQGAGQPAGRPTMTGRKILVWWNVPGGA